ncbi:MAG: type IV toxin-antitoxin system AbiEi family antitoxin domain-containing protein [Acidimicrobiales bacterium]|nr:type IV toxin-antitoxin system AbiEi family antitoxin domain-containing protein [Acidimicrobiales bacterium]
MFERIAAIAWRQHGAFSTTQAREVGVSETWLSRAAADGRLERRCRGVYVLAAAPATWRQRLMVEVLAAGEGALATGDSALALWCPEIEHPARPVVATPITSGRRTSPSSRVIRSLDLCLAKPGVVDGIPTVGVARALLDASMDRSVDAVVARINACQRHLPMSFGALADALHVHARKGRPGIATFRRALAAMTAEVPDSEFERLVLRDLARAGVPEPVLHHVVRVDGERPIELDLAWPDLRIDLELDGRDHLVRLQTARRDRQRDRILGRDGWTIPRYTWLDYLEDGAGMIDEIARLVATRPFRGC